MSFFDKMFTKKPKEDPAKKEEAEKAKNELATSESIDKLRVQQQKNDAQIEELERKIQEDTRAAMAAKNSGQKEKTIRLLAQVKNNKALLIKYSGMSTMLMKQISNLETVKEDGNVGDLLKTTNQLLQKNMEQQEKFMETLQDVAQLNEEFDHNQDQVNDIMTQANARLMEGLDEEFDKLEIIEIPKPTKNVLKTSQRNLKRSNVAQKDNFNALIDDLLT